MSGQLDITTGAFVAKRRDGQVDHGAANSITMMGGGSPAGGSISDILTALKAVDGTGSGLDADLLDGNESTYYAPAANPVFTGNATFDSTTLFVNGANHRVGIGKTNPSYLLDVNGIANATSLYAGGVNINTIYAPIASPTFTGTVSGITAAMVGLGNVTNNAQWYSGNHPTTLSGYGITDSPAISGTPANTQLGLWTNATTLKGDSKATFDGTTLNITGAIAASTNMGSASFTSGFAGSGWQSTLSGSLFTLTVDNLVVRRNMTIYQLNINKIQAINGGFIVSSACAQSISVSGTTIYIDEDNGNKQIQFAVDDYIWAKQWTGTGTGSYIGKVSAVNHNNTYGSANIVATTISGTPWNVMDLVQIGNASVSARQNLIYITASDTNNPYIDILSGVTDGSVTTHQVARLGNLTGITDTYLGSLSGYGLWSNNVYLSGSVVLPSAGMTNQGALASSVRIWAGDTYANRATAAFNVTQDGSLTASGVAKIGTQTGNYGGYYYAMAIQNSDIWENAYNGDNSTLYINRLGYQGAGTKYRNTTIGDGKANDIFTVVGGSQGYAAHNSCILFKRPLTGTMHEVVSNETPATFDYPAYFQNQSVNSYTITLPSSGILWGTNLTFVNIGTTDFTINPNGINVSDGYSYSTSSIVLKKLQSVNLYYNGYWTITSYNTLGLDTFVIDRVNKRIGVATQTPAYTVDVTGIVNATNLYSGGVNINTLYGPASSEEAFGNGYDGDATISGTTTLTKNMSYNNLTVNTGIILKTAGFIIRVKGTLTLTGTGQISCAGGAGGNASGTTQGAGGTAPYTTERFPFQPIPAGGGAGGICVDPGTSLGAGGAGSAVAVTLAGFTNFPVMHHVGGGSGGGGAYSSTVVNGSPASPTYIFIGTTGKAGGAASGTGTANLSGAGGGAGGGCMIVYCKTLSGSGSFSAAGGAGGNGQTSASAKCGNGSGGNGGSITVYYRTQSSWTGSTIITGGAAGTGGNGGVAGDAGYANLRAI